MTNKALGFIEVYGCLTAVAVADIALKSASIQLVSVEKVRGGLVAVIISGDVGAVTASIEAASLASEKFGKFHSVHVIARPSDDVVEMLMASNKTKIAEAPATLIAVQVADKAVKQPKSISVMKVQELRTMARGLNIDTLTKAEIKYAKRNELIDKIEDFLKRNQ